MKAGWTMKILIAVLKNRQGLQALAASIGGVAVMYFGGIILAGSSSVDVVILLGAIIAIAGTRSLCGLIVAMRKAQESTNNKDG